jgi:hypothetical protein
MSFYGRSANPGPVRVPTPGRPAPVRDRPSAWHWLLALPIPFVIAVPFYNRMEPELFGMPFFYWGQAACVPVGIAVTAFVRWVTRRRP